MREIGWNEASEEHIARHGIKPAEVEAVVSTRPRWSRPGRDGTELLYGTTDAGRYLLVVLAAGADGRHFVVTARDMDTAERRLFTRRARYPAPEGTRMTMNPDKLAELREYYDNTSTADDMLTGGQWETDVDPDPMVTTSLRLPKSLLDWVRKQAAEERVKPTALIRRWIEDRRACADDDVAGRLARLEQAVFHRAG